MLTIPYQYAHHISMINVQCPGSSSSLSSSSSCKIEKKGIEMDMQMYRIILSVDKGQVGIIQVTSFLTHALTPFPSEMKQRDDHYVKFIASHLVVSPYTTVTQTTLVKLPSGSGVKSWNKMEPSSRLGSKITYGPYVDIPANTLQLDTLHVHFQHGAKFMTLTNVVKEIEVSMWGTVTFEEVIEMVNTGATLSGGFSRLEYSMQEAVANSFNAFTAILPENAQDIYYRDIIGNITTSKVRQHPEFTEVLLRPRFPLFGGWKTNFYMGYTLPTEDVLVVKNGNQYTLTVPFASHIADATVDDLTVKVILPEGAKDAQVSFPFLVDAETRTTRLTYLDSTSLIG